MLIDPFGKFLFLADFLSVSGSRLGGCEANLRVQQDVVPTRCRPGLTPPVQQEPYALLRNGHDVGRVLPRPLQFHAQHALKPDCMRALEELTRADRLRGRLKEGI